MIYTNELNEILNDLKQETNPGKTISAVDVVLRIMKKYYSEEFVEDLNLTVFIKKYFEDRNKFNSLIDDLITLQGNFKFEKTDAIMDSSLVNSLSRVSLLFSILFSTFFALILSCSRICPTTLTSSP